MMNLTVLVLVMSFLYVQLAPAEARTITACQKIAVGYGLKALFKNYPNAGGMKFTKIGKILQTQSHVIITIENTNMNPMPLEVLVALWPDHGDGSCNIINRDPIIQVAGRHNDTDWSMMGNGNYPQAPVYPYGPIPTNIGE